jgi:glycosyltransferase involved in cell wall biosynthesis
LRPNAFTIGCENAGLQLHAITEHCAFDPTILPAMRGLIKEHKPDIIQTHGVKSHFLIRLLSAHRQYRWIAFQHGYTWPNVKVRLYNQLDRLSLPAADHVVTVCLPFASALRQLGVPSERISIRHNSVRPFVPSPGEQAMQLRKTLAIPPGTPVLLTVGRLSREKGHRDLIEALAVIRRKDHGRGRQFYLVVVGDGPELDSLMQLASVLGIADRVSFAGHQSDVATYYTMADIVVLPSHTEGSPNVLLEAMAAGLPVVATTVGGVPEIAEDNCNALLVQSRNSGALAAAIDRLLDDESLRRRLGNSARTRTWDFTPEAYRDSMIGTYLKVLGRETGSHAGRRTPRASEGAD